MVKEPVEHKTIMSKNIHDFESYMKTIDFGYHSGDVTFTG